MNETLYVILKVVTSVSSLGIYVSPIPSMRRILKAKSPGEMQLIPLVGLFINCHLRYVVLCGAIVNRSVLTCLHLNSMLYGISIHDLFPMVFTFLFGEIMAVIYIAIFARVTSDRAYVRKICSYGSVPTVLVSLYAGLVWGGLTNQSMAETSVLLGYVCVLSSIALFSSPLMTVRKVVQTKNADSIPIALVTVGFISNTLWTLYGMAADEVFVWAPNVVCVLMGLVQILLYVKYNPNKRPESSPLDVITVDFVDEYEFSKPGKRDLVLQVTSPSFRAMQSPSLASINSLPYEFYIDVRSSGIVCI